MHQLNWVMAWRILKTTTDFNLFLLRFYQDQPGYNDKSGMLKTKLCERGMNIYIARRSYKQ